MQRVLVVGGGMVGMAFAVILAARLPAGQCRITLLEARPMPSGTPDPMDTRATALSLSSRDVLAAAGVWQSLGPELAAITAIHVSNQHRFGSSVITPEDVGDTALGYVVENHHIGRALMARASELAVTLRSPAAVTGLLAPLRSGVELGGGEVLDADLVVLADGSQSALRSSLGISVDRRSTGQVATVANVAFAGQQHGTAYERFTPDGPLALLPLPTVRRDESRFNLVWSRSQAQADAMRDADDAGFLSALQAAFGWRLGAAVRVGRRSDWPLDRFFAREQVRPGYLVLGNAAHGIHPVAGQGFNLSLRDAAAFADLAVGAIAAGCPLGDRDLLRRYWSRVADDQRQTVAATDLLSTLFLRRGPLVDLPRDAALAGLDLLPSLRRLIARRGTGRDTAVGNPGTRS